MREADRCTIEEVGIPSIVLMENAGHRIVSAMHATLGDLTGCRVAILCGRGNNGGDGFVVARILWQQGIEVEVVLLAEARAVQGDAAVNLRILRRLGLPVLELSESTESSGPQATPSWETVRDRVLSCDVLVDAILGTGLNKDLEGLLLDVVTDVNASSARVVAIDVPTGLREGQSDPGIVVEPVSGAPIDWTSVSLRDAIEAEVTVTLAAPKRCLLVPPADWWVGELVVADIGIPSSVIEGVPGDRLAVITPEELRWLIPPRRADAHKGDFGHVLIVAGSVGKTGAAVLAGLGAMRSGAGRVTVATPERCMSVVAAGAPEYMTLALPDTDDGTLSADALRQILEFPCDVIGVGPGLGTTADVTSVVRGLLEHARVPVVVDADGLNVLANSLESLAAQRAHEIILTPHPGEMARLCASSSALVQADRIGVASRFAARYQVTVVLKGATTVIASPDGATWLNLTGNPAMATGGIGDVLTGATAAWLGQLGRADAACQVAVYVHGLAGDMVAADAGLAVTATQVAQALGRAVAETLTDRDPDDAAAHLDSW